MIAATTLLSETGNKIVDLEDPTLGYEWAVLDVWVRDRDGKVYVYADAGCSCNYEYEAVRGWDDLQPISDATQFASMLGKHFGKASKPDMAERVAAISAVSKVLL